MDTEENVRRYWAFISYSHADKSWADWLHKALENYPMPRDLVGKPCPADAPIPKRFVPVFRDREELPTATDLGAVIARALKHARFLVVICSPRSAKSPWVEQEIVEYKRLHGEDRVLCLIVDGEPWASAGRKGYSADDECFPKAVRYRLGEDGGVSDVLTEPIAADAREGKDGKENAVIKLMAGLLGVGFDDLRRREQAYQRQRVRRLQITAAMFAVLFIAAIAAATYALFQKRAVQRTLSRSDLQLAVQARDVDDAARCAAYLARSLRSDPDNRAAAMAAYSFLGHHKIHPPVGPVLRHPAGVSAAFGSADGKFIVTAAGARVYLWSSPAHKLVAERQLDGTDVHALAPLVSGTGFVAGTAKGSLHFLNLADLKPTREPIDTASSGVNALAWNPAGDVLAVGIADNPDPKKSGGSVMRLAADGSELSRLALGHLSPLILTWSKDGGQLAAAGSSPYFYVFPGESPTQEPKELQSKLAIAGLSFTEKGTLRVIDIFTGLAEWDTAVGVIIGRPNSMSPIATKGAFSPDGSKFFGARRGPASYIYNANTGRNPSEPISPGFTVSNGAWLDDLHVLIYSESGLAQVRQIRPAVSAASLGRFRTGYPDVSALSPDGKVLAAGCSSDSLVRFFDTRTLKEISRPLRFSSSIHGIDFLADGRSLEALCWDGKIHRVEWRKALKFEMGDDQLVPVIEDAFSVIEEMRFNPQRTLAALPWDDGVKIIDLDSGNLRKLIPIEKGASAVTWSPDGQTLAVATRTQELRYFLPDGNPAKGRKTGKLNAPVVELAWSPDGSRIAALTNADRVDFFDPVTGNPTAVSFSTGPSCEWMLWVSSGTWLLTSDMDNVTKLSDPDTGVAVAKLPRIGDDALRSHALPDRGEVLLSLASGFARVPVPTMTTPPDWVPAFLEAIGGARLSAGKDEPLLDPDAWLSPDAFPKSSAADAVWSPLREWLLDSRADRPAAPGAEMTEPEVVKVRALEDKENEIGAIRKKMAELWNTKDDQKMAEALDLLDKALEMDPDLTDLHKSRLKIREFSEKPALTRDSHLGIAAAADSTLIEVLDAKTGAALAILQIDPPDLSAARKLVDEVLTENSDHAGAKEVLEKIKAATK